MVQYMEKKLNIKKNMSVCLSLYRERTVLRSLDISIKELKVIVTVLNTNFYRY